MAADFGPRLSGDTYCSATYTDLKEEYPTLTEKQLLKYCFSASYIVAFLMDGLGIGANERRLRFTNQASR